MFPLFLILIFSFFVFYSIKVMIIRSHDLYALSFLVLFMYTVFTQIAYVMFPELLDNLNVYYGSQLFYSYWTFMFFSFVFSFLIYIKYTPVYSNTYKYRVAKTKKNYGQYLFFLITLFFYLILSFYFKLNRSNFGYSLGEDSGVSQWFGIGFSLFTVCTLILYTIFRNKYNRSSLRKFSLLIFIVCILFVFQVLVATGARSGILYFFIAISFYELSPINYVLRYKKKKILIFTLIGFCLINILMMIYSIRGKSKDEINFNSIINYSEDTSKSDDVDLSEAILLQDYLAPSYLLFMSMHHNVIDPVETIKSNLANSLVQIKYPLLSHTVTSKAGYRFTRSEGWGYHLFVEGYNAVGWLGIIYNAILWNLGMALFYKFSRSNNREFNRVFLCIITLYLIAIMRGGQSYSFIKTSWMFLLPSLALLLSANNLKLVKFKKNRNV